MAPEKIYHVKNYLISAPEWLAFLRDHAGVIVPTWKTVEPHENMLSWADCVGLSLSGTVAQWGFQFDGGTIQAVTSLRTGRNSSEEPCDT